MGDNSNVEQEIYNLISLGYEGGYWDFKREWYSKNNKKDMLHDIICMANNLENKDGHIIIGIDEEHNNSIVDMKECEHRLNTQKLVDFLKSKSFAGGVRPTVYVKVFKCGTKEFDVIVIKNDDHVPYYLLQSGSGVPSYHIYTRIQDTNTPINSSADIDKVEYLWKKRFHLNEQPLERVRYMLRDNENWQRTCSNDGTEIRYYKFAPEYTLNLCIDDRSGKEVYMDVQIDKSPCWGTIKIMYHQTLLSELSINYIDGGRHLVATPSLGFIKIDNSGELIYHYFLRNTLRYDMHSFCNRWENFYDSYPREKFDEVVLVFSDQIEKEEFEYYIREHIIEFRKNYFEISGKFLKNDIQIQEQTINIQRYVAKTLKLYQHKFYGYI